MKAKDGLSAAASLCAVLAFLGGTAASTIYAGLFFAGCAAGSFLLFGLVDCAQDASRGKPVTFEVLRSQSAGELWGMAVAVGCAVLAMVGDAIERGEAWNQDFGLGQLVALALIAGGAYVVWGEWRYWRALSHKQCPLCANKVLAEARKCQHCGHDFKNDPSTAPG